MRKRQFIKPANLQIGDNEYTYYHLGEEGEEIHRIIQTIDPEGEMGLLDIWLEYLEQELTFPFADESASTLLALFST